MAITVPDPINRLRASVVFATNPSLNLTATLLAKRGISVSWSGDVVTNIPVMTGVVQSLEPYVPVNIMAHIVKTLALANAYKAQIELLATVGTLTLRSDSKSVQPWQFYACAIQGLEGMDFSGTEADFTVRLSGFWPVNASIYGS